MFHKDLKTNTYHRCQPLATLIWLWSRRNSFQMTMKDDRIYYIVGSNSEILSTPPFLHPYMTPSTPSLLAPLPTHGIP